MAVSTVPPSTAAASENNLTRIAASALLQLTANQQAVRVVRSPEPIQRALEAARCAQSAAPG